jgi:hypothetical protein
MATTIELSKKVIAKHPTAYVKDYSRFDGKDMQHTYRIVDLHLNVLGKGSTENKAWKDAVNKLTPNNQTK